MSSRTLFLACVAVVVPQLVSAQVAAGVSDERVRLPGAPGSIEGTGRNASVEGNQGALQKTLELAVPPGFPGLTPEINFTYTSSASSDVLGVGWSMPSFSIERMTSKGLQKYDLDDRFAVGGSGELLRTAASGADATYRARYEGGFVRYTWRNRGTGEAGSWVAEYPDGRVGYFGADVAGVDNTLAQVRVPASSKTFRWHLTTMVDRFGHEMKLTWTKDASGTALLERIDYVFEGATPRYSLRFTYENRGDIISDARPGFELRLTQRLKDVRLFAASEVVRAWVLGYEAETVSGGPSRLAQVARFGRGNEAFPIIFKFGYSKTLEGVCGADCTKPFVKNMGPVPADFGVGRATLIDMNGDALPDVLASTISGAHTFYYASLGADGEVSFPSAGVASARTTGGSAFVYGSTAKVQVLDVNGDGFVDITESSTGAVLCNDGSGDWQPSGTGVCLGGSQSTNGDYDADDTSDDGQVDPLYVRFFDFDNDRRIDRLRTLVGGTSTVVLANTPTGQTEVAVQNIGAVFDQSSLQLADMNGDGLQDPAQLIVSGAAVTVWYRLNLGFGQWGDVETATVTMPDANSAAAAELQDINGDGLADVVSVPANVVLLSINRNGGRFDAVRTLNDASLAPGSTMPSKGLQTIVAFADMNGNGSDDVVYIEPGGAIQYVELFPVRPNLLSRFENGVGSVERITYATSISEQARDEAAGQPWQYRVPNPMTVVKAVERYVTLTGSDSGGLKELTTYRYHSGFYDGVEKQFAGYAQVERELLSDMSRDAQEPGLFVMDFNVGQSNPLFGGALEKERVFALPGRELLRETRQVNEACAVEGGTAAVSFVCQRATDTILVERAAADAVTLRTERDFDGYGNVVALRELGVVNRGTPESPTACAPCLASGVFGEACDTTCVGDERFVTSTFVVPTTAWFTERIANEKTSASATGAGRETRTYYDGPAFIGLPAGQLTNGVVTRVSVRKGPGANDFIDTQRNELDAHGNVAVSLEPTASLTDATRGYNKSGYDAAGLLLISLERTLGGADVSSLRRDYAYEPAFGLVSQASNWVPYLGAAPLNAAQQTRYRYDAHGRVVLVLQPGETDANASESLSWQLADPASRVERRIRSSATSGNDVVSATCFDGHGRQYQSLRKINESAWQVDGFTEFDSRGAIVRSYQPYVSSTGSCEVAPPQSVAFTSYRFDPLARAISATDAAGKTRTTKFEVLATRVTDELGHVVVERTDGLSRLVALERLDGTDAATTRVNYDVFGNVGVTRDPSGQARTQTFDAAGRLTAVDDVNGGVTQLTLDDTDNVLRSVDAAGNTVETRFDAIGRKVAEWSAADEPGTRLTWVWDRLAGCTECTNAGNMMVQRTWPSGGEDRYGYDAESRAVFRARTQGGKTFIFRTSYDDADRVKTHLFPGGLSLDRSYDGAGRVTTISGVATEVKWDGRDNLEAITFANGATSAWTWDAVRRLSTIETKAKDGSAVLKLGYQRNDKGLITGITDGAGRVARAATFTNDALDRLRTATFGAETLTWDYDKSDNVLSVTSTRGADSRAHAGTFTYGTRRNAVLSTTVTRYDYDGAGRMNQRGASSLIRDYRGRVVSATGGAREGSFAYADADRVERTEGDSTTWYLGDDFELRDGISVLSVKLKDDRIARLESDALAATVFSDLAPASGSGALTPTGDQTIDIADAWLAQAAGKGVVQLSGGPTPSAVKALLRSAARRLLIDDVTALHSDSVHSVVAATGSSGALVGEQVFSPTGVALESKGFVDAYGFTGQQLDESTGLLHFKFRDLDTVTGRWDQVDPAFFSLDAAALRQLGESTTAYAYVGNDFANNFDPNGLKKGGGKGGKWLKNKITPYRGVDRVNSKGHRAKGTKLRTYIIGIAVVAVIVVGVAIAGGLKAGGVIGGGNSGPTSTSPFNMNNGGGDSGGGGSGGGGTLVTGGGGDVPVFRGGQ